MIAIIGGGLTGLALSHRLSGHGVEHRVFEAQERPGGVIRSGRVDGHLLEWGPQRGRLTAGMKELIQELDLEGDVVTSPPGLPLFVYRAGRLRQVPFSAAQFLATDLLSWRGKLRVALEPLTAGPDPREAVSSFFIRKIGPDAYEGLVAPLYGGLYGSDPADMVLGLSLVHVLREFGIRRSLLLPLVRRRGKILPPPALSFTDGLQTLTDALYRRNREQIRLGAPVRGLRAVPGRWAVQAEDEELEADQVVLTCPAPVAARLLEGVAPDASARIGSLHYNPLAVVHLHARTRLRGLGYQVALGEALATRGVTFNDSLFGREGIYTAYLGGARRPGVVSEPDDRIAGIALAEFRHVTGYDAEPLAVQRERMPAWDRSWTALEGLELPEGIRIAANWESRPGMPGRLQQAKRLAAALAGGGREATRTDQGRVGAATSSRASSSRG